MKRVTIRDVAREAGVSPSTVSRALKGHALISQQTRQAVEDACLRLRYVPDLTAQSLAGEQSRSIGVIVPDVSNPYFSALFTVIEAFAAEKGFSVLLINSQYDPELELEAVDRMLSQRVDGLLLVANSPASQLRHRELLADTPCVYIGNNHGPDCSYVESDSASGTRDAVQYLYRLGHRRIVFIGGGQNSRTLALRQAGYCRAMEQHGLTPIIDTAQKETVDMGPWCREATLKLFRNAAPPDAILAYSDVTAMQILDAAVELGLEAPRDFSIIGFDNTDFGRLPYIALTSVSQQKFRTGRLAVQRLLEKIGGDCRQTTDILQPELMIRSSCRKI